jgi:PmbA protein
MPKMAASLNEPGLDLAQWSLERARSAGADAAEVLIVRAESLSAGVRMGEVEKLKSSRERRLGVRVFVGKSSATAATAEMEREALGEFIAETVRMARLTAPDQWSGLPDPALHPRSLPELELSDPTSGIIHADRALELARTAERAALGADARIKNSEGAEFNSGRYGVVFANSQSFANEYEGTTYGLAVAPIAEEDGAMQLGHWYTQSRRFAGLDDAASVGLTAARGALRQDQDYARAGGVRSRHGGEPDSLAGGRGVGAVALSRRVVPGGQTGATDRERQRYDYR